MQQLQNKWVMACLDGSPISDAVVDYAAWIAKNVQSPLQFLHTLEHGLLLQNTSRAGNLMPNMQDALMQALSEEERQESQRLIAEGKALLAKAQARIANQPIPDVIGQQRHGLLEEAVLDLQDEIRVLVLGLRGLDHSTQGIGSQLENTIRALHKPIFIVNGAFKEPRSMLLAYNDTEGADKALAMICKSPLYKNMFVHVVNVSQNKLNGELLLQSASSQLMAAGIDHLAVALEGDPQTELLAYQEQNDLDMVAMGAFSHGKLRSLFFGSFTMKMLEANTKPILLLRA
jgi:nucleotide-binding universal stress UspA family protein